MSKDAESKDAAHRRSILAHGSDIVPSQRMRCKYAMPVHRRCGTATTVHVPLLVRGADQGQSSMYLLTACFRLR